MTSQQDYRTEFPDFGEMDVALPFGFQDISWSQDAMPSFAKEQPDGSFLRLWVDFADKDKGDNADRQTYFRFFLSHVDNEHNLIRDIEMSNEYADIVEAIDSWKCPVKGPRP